MLRSPLSMIIYLAGVAGVICTTPLGLSGCRPHDDCSVRRSLTKSLTLIRALVVSNVDCYSTGRGLCLSLIDSHLTLPLVSYSLQDGQNT